MKPFEVANGVVARRWEMEDAPAIFEVVEYNRERLSRWMPWVPDARSEYDIREFVRGSMERFGDGAAIDLGLLEDGRVIGGLGASIGRLAYDEADIGYWISAPAEGRGIVTEAASRLIDWLFTERDMHRITIRAAVENSRSRSVAERLGFTYEGVLRELLRLEDAHVDAALYSLLRHEWRQGIGAPV